MTALFVIWFSHRHPHFSARCGYQEIPVVGG